MKFKTLQPILMLVWLVISVYLVYFSDRDELDPDIPLWGHVILCYGGGIILVMMGSLLVWGVALLAHK
jgi:hypothetical protein